jgi:large subunit ribosomal protein L11
MAKETVEILVDGGKASAGPPLGPALGPTGINVGNVVSAINEKTKDYAGMKVPVSVIIDSITKTFEIEIGTPPTSALIKKELGLERGSQKAEIVGNLTIDQLIKVTNMKKSKLLGNSLKTAAKEVVGVCVSMGVTVENVNPREFCAEIDSGKYDDKFK